MTSATTHEACMFLLNNGIAFEFTPKIIKMLFKGKVVYSFTNTIPTGAKTPSNASILYALYFDALMKGDSLTVFKRCQISLDALAAIFSSH